MTLYLDTRGRPSLTIGICDRCNRKFPIGALMRDPNAPGLRVCAEDRDQYDPYRLPVRQPDRITSPVVRPDVPLDAGDPYEPTG